MNKIRFYVADRERAAAALEALRAAGSDFELIEATQGPEADYTVSVSGGLRNVLLLNPHRALVEPSAADVAYYLTGEAGEGERRNYDVITLGGGPAGMTAAMYTARANMSALILEELILGGLMTKTEEIENYPGFDEPILGFDLAMKMERQARRFGAEVHNGRADEVELERPVKRIVSGEREFFCPAVVVAVGTFPRKLGVPGEEEYYGRGVSYCATCDGALYRGEDVYVIGGGDSAVQEALYLSKLCRTVTVVHRRDELRAEKILQERAFAAPNVDFLWDTVVDEIEGDESGVTGLKLRNKKTGERFTRKVRGVFIFIGLVPRTDVKGLEALKQDEQGFIITDRHTATNVPGVFAAGDVRAGSFRQIATATADGCVASHGCITYINAMELPAFPR